jgi:hypothetical protein
MSSKPVIFPMGRSALNWVLSGGRPQRGSRMVGWSYRWQAFWFDQNLKAVDARCSSTDLRPPVFILGMWRSGTTFLHELLAAHNTLVAPTTWQCLNSSIHLLRPPPSNGQHVVRPMDSFVVGAESPQEDEFAMLAQGIPSAYLAFFDPRRLPELERWLDPQVWAELTPERWWVRWRLFLMSVQHGRSGRLLLKSPNHTFRIRAILANMPQSSFVWVLRDPADVFFSNVKMWRAMIERYSLWDVDPEILDRQLHSFLAAALRCSTDALLYAMNELPPERLAVVRYDDTINRPGEILARIQDRLGMASDQVDQDRLAGVIGRAASFPRTTYSDRRMPDVLQELHDTLARSYRTAYASHGV